jgi:hypothetical protein
MNKMDEFMIVAIGKARKESLRAGFRSDRYWSRGRLQVVLEPVHRIGLVRLEIRQDPEEQIGQLPDILLVHPGEQRKIRIGFPVHSPEVHLADVIRHTVPSFTHLRAVRQIVWPY